MPETIAEILSILEGLGTVAPEIITALQTAWASVTATAELTSEQQATINAGLLAAHNAVQAG
jgi:hypothetical protein